MNASTPNSLAVVVDPTLAHVIELKLEGVVQLPELRAALKELTSTRSRRKDLRCLVLNAEHVERFGRGAVVECARWITRHAAWFDMAITIAKSPSLKGSVLALSTCAPNLQQIIVNDYPEALKHLPQKALALTG